MSDAALTGDQLATLEAMLDRLVPSDEHGPGAREARVSRYISKRLTGPYAIHVETYREGLAQLDQDALSLYGTRFVDLRAAQQDALLRSTEQQEIDGAPDGFFSIVLAHTMEGMFADPEHGGNAHFIGWNLIGYKGVKYVWTEDDQRFGTIITEPDGDRSASAARAAMLASIPKA